MIEKTFIIVKKFSISNECYHFELFIHQRFSKRIFTVHSFDKNIKHTTVFNIDNRNVS